MVIFMNENYNLKAFLSENPGLRKAVRRAHLIMGVKIALILIVVAGLTAALATRYGSGVLPVGLLACLLPLILKPWRVFGKSRIGRIEEIDYESRRVNSSKNFADNRYTSMYTANFIRCTGRDGKGRRFTFFLDQKYESVYRKGDLVVKLSGLPCPANLTPGEHTVCPRCGQIAPSENAVCTGCGITAVRMKGM